MKLNKYKHTETVNNPIDYRNFYEGLLVKVDNSDRCGVVVQVDKNKDWYEQIFVQMADTSRVEPFHSTMLNIIESDDYD